MSYLDVLKKARSAGKNVGSYSQVRHEHGGISTGLAGVDRHMRDFGFPRGRITQVVAEQNSGKSTFVLGAIAQLHTDWDAGRTSRGRVLFINAERGFDREYAARIGVQIDDDNKFVFFSPKDGTEAIDLMEELIDTGDFDMVVLDSITGLVPRGILEMDLDKGGLPAAQARQNSTMCLRLIGRLANTNTAMVIVNHLGGGFQQDRHMNTIKKPRGGDMLQNFTSVMFWLKKTPRPVGEDGKPVAEENDSVATMVNIKITKNKVGRQHVEIPARLEFFNGFDPSFDLVQEGLVLGVLNKTGGSWIYYGSKAENTGKWISENAARQAVAEDVELFQRLRADIFAANRPATGEETPAQDKGLTAS